MRAIEAVRAGGPEVLTLVERPAPDPGAGEVVVDVAFAGVNFIDTYRRSGVYPAHFPHVPGSEGAGVVSAVGPGVTDVAVGDRVAWVDGPGSYAEQVVVAADRTVPVPDGVDLATAAALMLQGLTAHYLVDSSHPVGPGEDVLVHAGAGGVGLLLTQLAVARGARVITTVSTEAKAELSREAGATAVVRYDQLDDLTAQLPEAVRAVAPEGVHAVYDGVGRTTFDASLASLRPRGILVLFGGASGQVPPFDLQRLNSGGSLFVTRPTLGDHVATRPELLRRADELFHAVRLGALKVRVGGTYALADAGEAHRALEARETTGKLVLEVGGEAL
ncbi:NADPH2:quinone reductase [Flavimobilis soli]|uniref:NADPH2:quinone reductase n=1 Tax=Flavimobilis soli TaxID=442709 RepID=A0A2A9EC54_9MICO|nr:quinone oxidoreductase [Flavimobilis soli]PFG35842.1 NADPH2:quinone reductase [Flavimobilis soli]